MNDIFSKSPTCQYRKWKYRDGGSVPLFMHLGVTPLKEYVSECRTQYPERVLKILKLVAGTLVEW